MSESLTCICCGKKMKNIDPDGLQPMKGLAFHSPGHYGSTFFDSMDGSYITVAVCDECLSTGPHIVSKPHAAIPTQERVDG
ncbi:MAG: hypothetical protein AAFQ36_09350 [Pseudomonadota bacterium]